MPFLVSLHPALNYKLGVAIGMPFIAAATFVFSNYTTGNKWISRVSYGLMLGAPLLGFFEKNVFKTAPLYSIALLSLGTSGVIADFIMARYIMKMWAENEMWDLRKAKASKVENCFLLSFGFKDKTDLLIEKLAKIDEKLSEYDRPMTIPFPHYLGTGRLYYIIGFPNDGPFNYKAELTAKQVKAMLTIFDTYFPNESAFIALSFGEVTVKMTESTMTIVCDELLSLVQQKPVKPTEKSKHLIQIGEDCYLYLKKYFKGAEKIDGYAVIERKNTWTFK